MHLQFSLQSTPSWKHSQYFFTQKDFRQEQPLPYFAPSSLVVLLGWAVTMLR